MEDLKKLRAARGYVKSALSRIFTFLENALEIQTTSNSILKAKQKRLEQLFNEFENYNKEILFYDEGDNGNSEEIEEKYFNALEILNERINTNSEADTGNCSTFKAKLPTIHIPSFTGKYNSCTLMAYQLDRNATVDSTIAEFLSYLDKRALALEYVQSSSSSDKIHNPKVAINMTTTFGSRSCLYCKSSEHKLYTCSDFKLLATSDKLHFAKDNRLCKVCLNAHQGKCKYHFRCKLCRQAHNTLLHEEVLPSQPTVSLISNASSNKVLLPTVKVKLYSKSGQEVRIKAILDSASQISIATSKLIDVLGITPTKLAPELGLFSILCTWTKKGPLSSLEYL
ncbi:hypothetical protein K1T71_012954 [Dendrolimus kikuchii]|uniref:Uncharacterized protein n=1 Tax=Dendrolimus kikuchii TaxID=765133 RepID=A0ACC1CIJ1_9NEOP|nr:hypothetical protein K1T71_012954 [Dendrolimus kikuchii]